MKRTELERQLKADAEEHTPDPYEKIVRTAQAEGLLGGEATETYGEGGAAVAAKRDKRLLVWLASLFGVIVLCLAIILPIVLSGLSAMPITLSVNDVYGMGAVSTVKLLNGSTNARAIQTFAAVRSVVPLESDPLPSDNPALGQIERFHDYFTALDSFFGDNLITTETQNNQDVDYPYEMKMTIAGQDIDGQTVQYVMYYTETLLKESNKKNKTETKYSLAGVMVLDGTEYYLEGGRSFEQEEDETESELTIRAYAVKEDKNNYIEMKQETSQEENETEAEYVYSVYANGKLLEQTAVEFETERKGRKEKTEYELEFRTGNTKGKYKLLLESKKEGALIRVEYVIDGQKGQFTVQAAENNRYLYGFANGTTLVL